MYNFNALLNRLKYIPRWSLMRQSDSEDVAQHTTRVMLIAHTLAMISKQIYGHDVSSERIVLSALYHDASEILTGDMPTPVKYHDRTLESAYKGLELHAVEKLIETAEPGMRDELSGYMKGTVLNNREKKLLKAADRLAALIKCMEETAGGNGEFASALRSTKKLLDGMDLDEVRYFEENMLPGYDLCLDELARI